jgi:hypothetical protein
MQTSTTCKHAFLMISITINHSACISNICHLLLQINYFLQIKFDNGIASTIKYMHYTYRDSKEYIAWTDTINAYKLWCLAISLIQMCLFSKIVNTAQRKEIISIYIHWNFYELLNCSWIFNKCNITNQHCKICNALHWIYI